VNPMSPCNMWPVVMVKTNKEDYESLAFMETELHLGQWRKWMQQQTIDIGNGQLRTLSCPLFLDWKALRAVTNNTGEPARKAFMGNPRVDRLCCVCKFDVREKMKDWKLHPFRHWYRDSDDSWSGNSVLFGVVPSEIGWETEHCLCRGLNQCLVRFALLFSKSVHSHCIAYYSMWEFLPRDRKAGMKRLLQELIPGWSKRHTIVIHEV